MLAAQSGKAIQVEDLKDSPAYRSGDYVAAVEIAGIRTIISVPMFKDNECVGAIALSRKEIRLFSEKQIELVANFANRRCIGDRATSSRSANCASAPTTSESPSSKTPRRAWS